MRNQLRSETISEEDVEVTMTQATVRRRQSYLRAKQEAEKNESGAVAQREARDRHLELLAGGLAQRARHKGELAAKRAHAAAARHRLVDEDALALGALVDHVGGHARVHARPARLHVVAVAADAQHRVSADDAVAVHLLVAAGVVGEHPVARAQLAGGEAALLLAGRLRSPTAALGASAIANNLQAVFLMGWIGLLVAASVAVVDALPTTHCSATVPARLVRPMSVERPRMAPRRMASLGLLASTVATAMPACVARIDGCGDDQRHSTCCMAVGG